MKKMILALAVLLAPMAAQAQDVTARTTVTERSILPAGQWTWDDTMGFKDPIYVQVNLTTQMAYVFRGEYLIGATSISSGKPGKDTPLGTFPILQKEVDHRSSLYDDAPMPFMERLTWDGVALHAGRNPGHAASHGCVRLPLEFARLLYGVTRRGDVVEITAEAPTLNIDLTDR